MARKLPTSLIAITTVVALAAGWLCLEPFAARAQEKPTGAPPAKPKAPDAPKGAKLAHVTFDVKRRQVRVDAEALGVDAPLEFFCVKTHTSEHESVLRSPVKPSDLHTALLAIGMEPGRPVTWSDATKKWFPPEGPPLHISIEWADQAGKTVSAPAYRLMRDVKNKKPMPALNWVFAGSRVMKDGQYAADVTGYIVSVVNFDLTMIDIPELKSNANETLEWERNPETSPPPGTKVTMVIEPAGNRGPTGAAPDDGAGADAAPAEATEPAAPAAGDGNEEVAQAPALPGEGVVGSGEATEPGDAATTEDGGPNEDVSEVQLDEKRMQELRAYWLKTVRPHASALKEAAQAHYDVITAMRAEQQRLIDEADRLQRAIDALEKEYQDMTTPRPPAEE